MRERFIEELYARLTALALELDVLLEEIREFLDKEVDENVRIDFGDYRGVGGVDHRMDQAAVDDRLASRNSGKKAGEKDG